MLLPGATFLSINISIIVINFGFPGFLKVFFYLVYWDIEAKLAVSILALPFRFVLKYGTKQERILSRMESSRATFGKIFLVEVEISK
jgi:hypothetical protein